MLLLRSRLEILLVGSLISFDFLFEFIMNHFGKLGQQSVQETFQHT